MRVAQINATCGVGSTGRICAAVSRLLTDRGVENRVFYTSGHTDLPEGIRYMSKPEMRLAALQSRILGNWGFNSLFATRRLIRMLDAFQPDIVHLHNLHGHNVHLLRLLRYLRDTGVKVVWTFHDCWAFTGYCMHYNLINCTRWKSQCHSCPQRKTYSWLFDRSSALHRRKMELLSEVDLTIVTPSQWMAEQVRQSPLKDKPVRVIHNGIDLQSFQPQEKVCSSGEIDSSKYTVLAVSFGWDNSKGLDVLLELADRLPENYQLVLVGTDDKLDAILPENVISVHRTANVQELADLYSSADVFVNATRADTFPTVNMEALACGTPVVTFATGGSAEIPDETCGLVVPVGDVQALTDAVRSVCEEPLFSRDACVKRAAVFESAARFQEYLQLYDEVLA